MKNKTILVLILINSLVLNKLYSQNWERTVAYTVNCKTVYQFSNSVNTAEIPSEEFIMMSPSEKVEHHNEYYSALFGYINEITTSKDTDYPKWMEIPAKKIIDRNGISLYDINGILTIHYNYDSLFKFDEYVILLDLAANEGPFPVFNFSKFTQSHIEELVQIGFEVNVLEDGVFQLLNGQRECIVNSNTLQVITIEKNESGVEIERTEKTYYRDIFGIIYPKESIRIVNKFTKSQVPYKKIEYSIYTNFIRGGSDVTYNLSIDKTLANKNTIYAEQIVVFPNPTSNLLNIMLPNYNSDDNKNVELVIKDLYGNNLISKNIESGQTVNFDISQLSIGSYVVQISWRGYQKLIHFIKL